MGIRFECPNGHKLNVKADLAGKRAICPSCGAKVVIPTAQGGIAADGDSSPEMSRVATGNSEPVAAATAPVAASTPPAADPPPAKPVPTMTPSQAQHWYVRPSAGGQYGPATAEVFRDWITEGRVEADAYVWREGWSDWKFARDAADELPALLAATPAVASPPSAAVAANASPVGTASAGAPPAATLPTDAEAASTDPPAAVEAPSPAARYTARRRRSKKKQFTLAVVMLLAVIVLAAVLVWVVRRNAGPEVSGRSRVWVKPAIKLAQIGRWPYVADCVARPNQGPQLNG